ncbi:hypothetical protein H1Z61_05875 [Bacillus aquiflavi]|uniref:Uncharacterized protein n=1 Tax=Bacillus aquiflavi TaxID=2672567 RepID=A0A6B3VZL8_9BACI|nr:hypothetical protein [Bacillus aquiflavi]MBA4536683.1 hypothetical protein [Bacillus aquiflavi]NEY81051.1 hypothetical protein [Bacillus aquiflavi]UAC48719.1 hypothetical protein K6959_01725 [Bacillus aquiflavi]
MQINSEPKASSNSCCTGNEILCISIPSPIDIVLLGIQLQIELPCLRITSPSTLSNEQIEQLQKIIRGSVK